MTARVTKQVSYLGRWIAADLYLKEVDSLAFELSMAGCNEELFHSSLSLLKGDRKTMVRSSSMRSSSMTFELGTPSMKRRGQGSGEEDELSFPEGLVSGTKLDRGDEGSITLLPRIMTGEGSSQHLDAFSEAGDIPADSLHMMEMMSPGNKSGWASPARESFDESTVFERLSFFFLLRTT